MSGMAEARQTGRFEVFRGSHITILDGAHNEGGAKALADTVTEMCPESRILMVAGLLADKDAAAILKNFMRITHDFIATRTGKSAKTSGRRSCGKDYLNGRTVQIRRRYRRSVQNCRRSGEKGV